MTGMLAAGLAFGVWSPLPHALAIPESADPEPVDDEDEDENEDGAAKAAAELGGALGVMTPWPHALIIPARLLSCAIDVEAAPVADDNEDEEMEDRSPSCLCSSSGRAGCSCLSSLLDRLPRTLFIAVTISPSVEC